MKTDSPLKAVVKDDPVGCASWLLQREVLAAKELPSEFNNQQLFADLLYRITLAEGKECLLHIEFQAGGSHLPMAVRMLNYFTLLCVRYKKLDIPIYQVVIYLGQGVGKNDTGAYTLGVESGTFHYQVVHLWDVPARDLLAFERPALLALIGQTKFSNPREEIRQAVDIIASEVDAEAQADILSLMQLLLPSGDEVRIMENVVREYGLHFETPYMRELRQEGHEQGMQEGVQQGIQQGMKQGVQKGLKQGQQQGVQNSIINAVQIRFDVGPISAKPIHAHVRNLPDMMLQEAFTRAITCQSLEEFTAWLEPHAGSS